MASNQELTSDQRFSRVTKDPRFWEMPEKDKKIKIDKRFRAMFHDQKFNLQYTVDKRGRPVNHNTTEDLKRYYDLSDSDEDVLPDKETALDTKKEKKKAKQKKKDEPESKNTSAKIKEKKGAVTPEEVNKSKVEKKVKTKGNILLKQINIEEEVKTKEEPSTSVTTKSGQKSTKVIEQEESEEESGLEDESDEYSSGEVHSHEEMSGMELEEDEESDGESEDGNDSEGEESEEAESEGAEDDDEEASSGEEEDSDSGPDLARGKGNIETSSEEEDDEEDDELDLRKEVEIEHSWREMDKDAPRGDEVTRRLAVCNMDWDRLKAKDLLALFNSFRPKGGIVFSVKIYPSEFGKEKLKEEELHGPSELKNISEDVSEEQKLNKERLREYQFKRLKYYFAVVECDTPETANKIYEECDGLEFESSCSFVDLRFIPDEVQFDDEPKDAAVDVDLSAYTPKYFTSAAMVTSKVELTWDETDQERVTTLNRPFKKNEILDMDFQAYLASSSEEEEEIEQETEVSAKPEDVKCKKGSKDDDEQIERYRQLVKGIQEKEKKQQEKDVEMEVKWVPGLKESAEQMVKNKLEGKDKLTPWEKYLQKQKDKKKLKRKKKESVEESTDEDDVPSDVDYNDPFFSEELKKPGLQKTSVGGKKQEDQESSADEEEKEKQKAEMALLMMDDVEDERKHFNYDQIVEQQNLSRSKKKKLKKKDKLVEDDFQINVEDSRFQALYTSHLYNVDPSDPNFKKTKAMEKVLVEKAKRREKEQKNYTETVKRQQENLETGDKTGKSARKAVDPALSLLLKSIKTKTQQFQASKKQKTK
ncbi:ESF1 homolog [Bufo bufo]|uniref:ESF1 homolog n=1 Tax=Bufo bufo TaxID=8384 RepID=UPI001ABE330B|nr:ESF1 homolog [Bufo bufo]XP_040285907.1 ESF1 homolog [Bufo bufo]XP_040285908.1 ESF1 homolog [Bufo bufo]